MGLLDKVETKSPSLPSRVVFYGAEKSGKSSFAAFAPKPLFLMTSGETGLLSLIESGQVPPTPYLPELRTWTDLLNSITALVKEDHDFKTLVLDTGNGAEHLCISHVRKSSFQDNQFEFASYGKGMDECVTVWQRFLSRLDDLRVNRGMSIIFLHHSTIKTVENPSGKDWSQHRPEASPKLWSLTHKWADVIAYYGLKVKVDKHDKAFGEERYIRCNGTSAIVAGNRYGMPDEITAPIGARNLWKAFATALRAAKTKPQDQGNAAPVAVAPTSESAAQATAEPLILTVAEAREPGDESNNGASS